MGQQPDKAGMTGCARWAAGSALVLAWALLAPAVQAAPRLPTEAFAQLPQVQYLALSPDGQWTAAVMNRAAGAALVVTAVDGKTPPKALLQTDNRESRLAWVQWVRNDRLLVSLHFPDQRRGTDTLETRLVALDRDGGHRLNLLAPAPFDRAVSQLQDQVVDWLPEDGHHVLLQAASDRRDSSPAVWRVDVDSGEREIVHSRRFGVRRWLTDRSHRVRVGVQQLGTRVEVLVCDADGSHWRSAWSYALFDGGAVQPLGFGADPDQLFIAAEHDGRRAVYAVDLRDPALQQVLQLDLSDADTVGRLLRDPPSGRAIGVAGTRDGDLAANFWDPATQALARAIDAALPDRLNRLLQFSADGTRYLLLSSGNGVPGQFLIGDRGHDVLTLLARQYPDLPPELMLRKQRLATPTRDGQPLTVYLTLPAGAAAAPLPTVLLPQGGAIARDTLDFDPLAQFLAQRGYAVLQVNARAGGAGTGPRRAGVPPPAEATQHDLGDALQWLVQRGNADPARVCIVGSGFGGQAALMAGALTPERWRCVVSLGGVSDLPDLAQHRARYLNGSDVFARQIGAPWADRQRLQDNSPRRLAAQFSAPVLLLHGTADRSVPFAQSQAMADALGAAGKSVRLVALDDGDAALSHAAHRLQFYRELEDFLAAALTTPPAPPAPPAPVASATATVPR
jgi:dipeptidyl aminopeptidase/acylaminoacyl peptidase